MIPPVNTTGRRAPVQVDQALLEALVTQLKWPDAFARNVAGQVAEIVRSGSVAAAGRLLTSIAAGADPGGWPHGYPVVSVRPFVYRQVVVGDDGSLFRGKRRLKVRGTSPVRQRGFREMVQERTATRRALPGGAEERGYGRSGWGRPRPNPGSPGGGTPGMPQRPAPPPPQGGGFSGKTGLFGAAGEGESFLTSVSPFATKPEAQLPYDLNADWDLVDSLDSIIASSLYWAMDSIVNGALEHAYEMWGELFHEREGRWPESQEDEPPDAWLMEEAMYFAGYDLACYGAMEGYSKDAVEAFGRVWVDTRLGGDPLLIERLMETFDDGWDTGIGELEWAARAEEGWARTRGEVAEEAERESVAQPLMQVQIQTAGRPPMPVTGSGRLDAVATVQPLTLLIRPATALTATLGFRFQVRKKPDTVVVEPVVGPYTTVLQFGSRSAADFYADVTGVAPTQAGRDRMRVIFGRLTVDDGMDLVLRAVQGISKQLPAREARPRPGFWSWLRRLITRRGDRR